MTPLFHFEMINPSYKPLSKKNNRPIFRRGNKTSFIGKSNKLRSQENLLFIELIRHKSNLNMQTITKQIHVKYLFYYGPELNRSYPRQDLSNLFELVSDSLQRAQVIKNDNQIMSFDGSRKLRSTVTRLVVEIYEYEETF